MSLILLILLCSISSTCHCGSMMSCMHFFETVICVFHLLPEGFCYPSLSVSNFERIWCFFLIVMEGV